MDFAGLKRRDLQALCKRHGLPAGGTNVALVARLTGALLPPAEAAGAGEDVVARKGGLKRPARGNDLRETEKKVSFVLPQSTGTRRQSQVFSSPPIAVRPAGGRGRGKRMRAEAAGASTSEGSVAAEADGGAPARRSRRNSVCLGDVTAAEAGGGPSVTRSRRNSLCLGHVKVVEAGGDAPLRRSRRNSVCLADMEAVQEGGDAPGRRTRRNSVCLADIEAAEVHEDIDRKGKGEETATSAQMGVSRTRVMRRSSLSGDARLSPLAFEKKQGKRKAAGGKSKPDAEEQVAKAQDLARAALPAIVGSKKSSKDPENCEHVVTKVEAPLRIRRSRSVAATAAPIVVENKRRRMTKDVEQPPVLEVPRNDAPVTRTLRNKVVQVSSHLVEESHVGQNLKNKRQPSRPATRHSQHLASSTEQEDPEQVAAPSKCLPLRRSGRNICEGSSANSETSKLSSAPVEVSNDKGEDVVKQPTIKEPARQSSRRSIVPAMLQEEDMNLVAQKSPEAHVRRSKRKSIVSVQDKKGDGEEAQNAKIKHMAKQPTTNGPIRRSTRKSIVPAVLEEEGKDLLAQKIPEAPARRSKRKSVVPVKDKKAVGEENQKDKDKDVAKQTAVREPRRSTRKSVVLDREENDFIAAKKPKAYDKISAQNTVNSETKQFDAEVAPTVLSSCDVITVTVTAPQFDGQTDKASQAVSTNASEWAPPIVDSKQESKRVEHSIQGADMEKCLSKGIKGSPVSPNLHLDGADADGILPALDAAKGSLSGGSCSSFGLDFLFTEEHKGSSSRNDKDTVVEVDYGSKPRACVTSSFCMRSDCGVECENVQPLGYSADKTLDVGQAVAQEETIAEKSNDERVTAKFDLKIKSNHDSILHSDGAEADSILPALDGAKGSLSGGSCNSFGLDFLFAEERKESSFGNDRDTVVEVDYGSKPSACVSSSFCMRSDCGVECENVQPLGYDADNTLDVGQTVAQEETIAEKSNDERIAAKFDLKIKSNHDSILHLNGAEADSILPALDGAKGSLSGGSRNSFGLDFLFAEERKESSFRNNRDTVVEVDYGSKPSACVTPNFYMRSDCGLECENVQPLGYGAEKTLDVGQTAAQEETIAEKSNNECLAAKCDLKINSNHEAVSHCILAEKSTRLVAESCDDEQAIFQVQQGAVHGGTHGMLPLCSTTPECKDICRLPEETGPHSIGNKRCSSPAEQSSLGVQSLFSQESLDDSMEHSAPVSAICNTTEKTTMSQPISQCDTQLVTVTDDSMHMSQQDNALEGLPEVSHEGKLVTSSLSGFSVDANQKKEVINSEELACKIEGSNISHFEDRDVSCEKSAVNLSVDSGCGISGTELGCPLHAPDSGNDYVHLGSNLVQLESADLLDELIGSSNTEVQHPSQKEHCIEDRKNQVASRPCTNGIMEATTTKCFESGVVLLPAEGSEKLKDSQLDSKLKSTQAVESGCNCNKDKDISNTSDDGSVSGIVGERNSCGFTLPKGYPAGHYLQHELLDDLLVEKSLEEPGTSGGRNVSNAGTVGNPSFGSAMSEHNGASFEEVVHRMKNFVGTCPPSPKELLLELQSVSPKENIKESSMLESAKDVKSSPSCDKQHIRDILDNGSAVTVVYEKFLFVDKSDSRMNIMNNYVETCSSDPRELLMDLQSSSNETVEDDPCNDFAFPNTERDEGESTICHVENLAETVVASDTDVFLGPSQDFSRDEAKQDCTTVSLHDAQGSLKSNHLKDTSEDARHDESMWAIIAEKVLCEEKNERESLPSSNCDILDENSHTKRYDEIDSKLSSCDAEVLRQDHVEGCEKVNEDEVNPAGLENSMSEAVALKRIESKIMMDGEGEEYSFSCNANTGDIMDTGSAFPDEQLNTNLDDPEKEKSNCVINKDTSSLLDTELAGKSKVSNLSNDTQLDPFSEHLPNVSQWDPPSDHNFPNDLPAPKSPEKSTAFQNDSVSGSVVPHDSTFQTGNL